MPSVNAAVNVGQDVEVKVLNVDTKKRRIGLSRKATMKAPENSERARKTPEVEEKARELAVKPMQGKLKGGRENSSGGEQFGLKW